MMPTFDFSNIIARLSRFVMVAISSPLVLTGLVAVTVSSASVHILSLFKFSDYAKRWVQGGLDAFSSNSFSEVLLYVFNIQQLVVIMSYTLDIIFFALPALFTFFFTWWAMLLTHKAWLAFRASTRDVLGA